MAAGCEGSGEAVSESTAMYDGILESEIDTQDEALESEVLNKKKE